MKYVLVEWQADKSVAKSVTFHEDDDVYAGVYHRLTDRIVLTCLQILNEEKEADPRGLYLPMIHYPNKTGARILVVHDAFARLSPDFIDIVQQSINEGGRNGVHVSKHAGPKHQRSSATDSQDKRESRCD